MITLHHDPDQFAPFFIESVLRFQKEHRQPKGLAVSLDEKEKQISIHFNPHLVLPIYWQRPTAGRELYLSFYEQRSRELANKLARPKAKLNEIRKE